MSEINFSEMTRGQRIKLRRNTLKISPQYISRYIDINRVTYLNWEKDEVGDISWPKFMRLSEVLMTTPYWLEYGKEHEEYTYNDQKGDIKNAVAGQYITKSSTMPLYSIVDNKLKLKDGFYIDMPAKSMNVYAIQLDDHYPHIKAHTGDALIIDKSAKLTPGEEILIRTHSSIGIYIFNYHEEDKYNITDGVDRKIVNKDDVIEASAIVGVARNGYVKKN